MMFNSTSLAVQAGTCSRCGGQLYQGLVHFCGTAVRQPTVNVDISSDGGIGRAKVEVPTMEQYLDLLRRVEALEAAAQSDDTGTS